MVDMNNYDQSFEELYGGEEKEVPRKFQKRQKTERYDRFAADCTCEKLCGRLNPCGNKYCSNYKNRGFASMRSK